MDKSGGQSVAYLIDPNLMSNKIADLSIDSITNLFKRVAAGLVFYTSKLGIKFVTNSFLRYSHVDLAMKELEGYSRRGMASHDAWNHSSIHLIKAAQAHARYFVADCFARSIKEGKFSAPVRSILNQLCELLLIYWLVERSGDFFMVSPKMLCCLNMRIYD